MHLPNKKSAPEVLLIVSTDYKQWSSVGCRNYHNVLLTVCHTDSVRGVMKIADDYTRRGKIFDAVCLASSHGAETQPQLKWKHDGHLTLTLTSVKTVARLTTRVHIITCWQGRFLKPINVPGIVLSGYNTWMNGYGEDEEGQSTEPEPWQLHYVGCGLPTNDCEEHCNANGNSCSGRCKAGPGKLVIKSLDNSMITI
jgi:hypothetical protein